MTDRKRRIWMPSAHNLWARANDNYLHSLWLGTVGLLTCLPYMLTFQLIMPLVEATLGTLSRLVTIGYQFVAGIGTFIIQFFWRLLRVFLYGVFGYLDTVETQEVYLAPPGPGDDMLDPARMRKSKPGMHQEE